MNDFPTFKMEDAPTGVDDPCASAILDEDGRPAEDAPEYDDTQFSRACREYYQFALSSCIGRHFIVKVEGGTQSVPAAGIQSEHSEEAHFHEPQEILC